MIVRIKKNICQNFCHWKKKSKMSFDISFIFLEIYRGMAKYHQFREPKDKN